MENDIWEKEAVAEFERRMAETRWQEEIERNEILEKLYKVKLNLNTKKFKKSKLPGKYIVKILFELDNRKFEDEYLKNLEKN